MAAWAPRRVVAQGGRRLAAWCRAGLAGMAALLMAWSAGAATSAAPASRTLDKIARSGQVLIGHREYAMPFSYVVDGRVMGYAIDICLSLVRSLQRQLGLPRLDVRFVPVTAASRFVLIGSGSIDLECGSTTGTADRRKLAEFSYPYALAITRFLSRRDAGFHTLASLAGRSVAAISGTINLERLNALNRVGNLNISVLLSRTHEEAFDLVQSGRAAAMVGDDVLLAGLMAMADQPADFEISAASLDQWGPYGLLMPPGDTGFRDEINRLMRGMFARGEIRALYAKWFESPIAPRGRTLGLPPSAELDSYFRHPRDYSD